MNTALHLAVHDPQRLLELLNAGANPAAVDARGRTALHWAALYNKPASTAALLHAGGPTLAACQDSCYCTAVHLASGNLKCMRQLLEAAPGVASVTNNWDRTALHLAVLNKDAGSAGLLLVVGGGVELARVQDNSGFTALHLGAIDNYAAGVKLLLEVGGGAQLAKVGDRDGCTALQRAAARNHVTCTELLLQFGGGKHLANIKNRQGWTALHSAAAGGNADCVRLLLQVGGGGELAKIQSTNGWTALHLAANASHTACVELLLEFGGGAELAIVKNKRGYTALHMAASRADHRSVGRLLEGDGGPELAKVQDNQGITALHLAAGRSCAASVELLLAAGCADLAAVLDIQGSTALHWAVDSLECSRLLLDAAPGLVHTTTNSNGAAPLHALCLIGPITSTNVQVAQLLVDRGASVTAAVLEAACQALGSSMEVVAEGDPCLQLCLLLAKELCRTQPQLLYSPACPEAVREVAVLLLPSLVATEAAAREELSSYRAGEAERTRGAQDLLVQAAGALKGLQRRRQDCDV